MNVNSKISIKLFVTLFLVFYFYFGQSQVNLNFNVHQNGKNIIGLTNLKINNSLGREFKALVEIDVKIIDGVKYNQIFKITFNNVIIKSGSSNLQSITKNETNRFYDNSIAGNYIKETSLMPEGDLEFCFKISEIEKTNVSNVYQECFNYLNILSTPLTLNEPENKDEICNKRPKFSWIAPNPLPQNSTFSIKLVELKQEQSISEALQLNIPILFQANIHNSFIIYPSTIPELKENVNYVWQVYSVSKGQIINSEIWEFKVSCSSEKTEKKINDGYIEINEDIKTPIVNSSGILKFSINNQFIVQNLSFNILNIADPSKKIKGLPKLKLELGKNYLQINLNSIVGLELEKEYVLNVVMPNGKHASLRFKYNSIDE